MELPYAGPQPTTEPREKREGRMIRPFCGSLKIYFPRRELSGREKPWEREKQDRLGGREARGKDHRR